MWIIKSWTISAVFITLCLSLGATFAHAADVCNNRNQFVTRPIPLGLCGNNTRTACNGLLEQGTLGGLVTKNNSYFILGASHTLAVSNAGVVGDPIVQPSGAPVADKVATLSSFTTLSTTSNTVDAAIAAIVANDVQLSGTIQNIGQVSTTPLTCTLNAPVQIMGCGSCHIPGMIQTCVKNLLETVDCVGNAPFINQVGLIMNAQPGDSGALVVSQSTTGCPRPVGLLISGLGGAATANPISAVLSTFGVSIVGKTCTTLATASDGSVLPQEDLQPTQEQLQADDVARTLGPELLKIPGVWGDESTDDENGHMIIKVMVDAITPEVRQAVPSTLGGFPVRIYQMEREVMLGDSMCGAGKKHGTTR
jgi:hypothetical protein